MTLKLRARGGVAGRLEASAWPPAGHAKVVVVEAVIAELGQSQLPVSLTQSTDQFKQVFWL